MKSHAYLPGFLVSGHLSESLVPQPLVEEVQVELLALADGLVRGRLLHMRGPPRPPRGHVKGERIVQARGSVTDGGRSGIAV